QISPTVTMRPGEVQRWRFVNATMQVAAQVSIFFPAGTTVKQIAMDGVRFAPENYGRQPLFDPASPAGFTISPGNRADFLVQAPAQAGSYPVTHRNAGRPAERTQRKLEARDESLAPGPPLAPLVTLVVAAASEGAPPAATGFPTQAQWPPMPEFLQDIKPEEVVGTQELMFSMQEKSGLPGLPGDPATMFFINGIQYDEHCVNVTTKLGTALDWTVSNSSLLNHPFHIHINPFQVLRNGATTYTAPYVWQDTIALPAPAKIGDPPQSVLFRHRYLDFTGEYVLHCHFLGHEDRGMMFGVQTVCKDDPAKFGKPTLDEAPECVAGNLIPSSPVCGTPPAAAGAAAPGH
ncbi:MAG TPA: multicopper oxidase domain-containing protein, partial [Thermoanaerobaculia bacterium]